MIRKHGSSRLDIQLSRRLATVLAATAALVIVVSGCGTARVDLKTDVVSPQEVNQELLITADGAVGDSLRQSFDPEKMRQDGWTTDLKSQGNGYVLRMSKKLTGSGSWLPASTGATSSTTSAAKFDYKVNEGFLDREYNLHIVLPASPMTTSAPKTELERQGQQLGEQLIRNSFNMAWTINLPGEVTDTNADSKTKNGGTWEIGFDGMQKGVDMRISSRERKDSTVYALAGGGVILFGLVGFAAARSRRKTTGQEPAGPLPMRDSDL